MDDVSEALERLAGLRDRGVLTQEEFDHQKAMLLNPAQPSAPVPPAAAPYAVPYAAPGGHTDKTWMFVAGGVALLIAAAVVLWATGTLGKWGIGGPSDTTSSMTAFNPFAPAANTSAVAPMGIPPMVAPAPVQAPAYGTPYASAAGGENPLIGSWAIDGSPGADCPSQLAFSAASLTMTGIQGNGPVTKTTGITYQVQDASTVAVTATDNNSTETAHVNGASMTLGECSFHRAY